MIRPRPMRGPGMGHATRVVTSSTVDSGLISRPSTLATRPATDAENAVLQDIAADMATVITDAAAATPADPLARLADAGQADRPAAAVERSAPGFSEGTQALLDRLERLGDMRDRGLLTVEEFEAAKATIVAELESRS